MNVDAVDVFQPMGCSPIPTDIFLVGVHDDSNDKFDTPEQSPVFDTTKHPTFLDFQE